MKRSSRVALVVIYNHQYNENIPIVEEVYRDRFTDIYHLVPFYKGNLDNVIPVYENSFYFQGYIAQGLTAFFKEKYDHYLFIGDDLLLNPVINENNYREILKLGLGSSYMPRLDVMHSYWKGYNIKARLAHAFDIKKAGVEAEEILPTYADALTRLSGHKVEVGKFSFDQINKYFNHPLLSKIGFLFSKFRVFGVSYPLTSSYADIFAISGCSIKEFCHYCGVFAALDLWVEIAAPTALALSSQSIIRDDDLEFKGRALWTADDFMLLDKYNYSLSTLLADFPPEYLYLHPIKMSKWRRV